MVSSGCDKHRGGGDGQMTEAEKRALAFQIKAQEQQRLASTSFCDHNNTTISHLHGEIRTRQQVYIDFAQNGITFQQFQAVYSSAYEQGRSDMLTCRFSFFYRAKHGPSHLLEVLVGPKNKITFSPRYNDTIINEGRAPGKKVLS